MQEAVAGAIQLGASSLFRAFVASQVITRPNNVTAYAAGQVWGDGVDARITLVAPARPVNMVGAGFGGVTINLVNRRSPADAALNLTIRSFVGVPATVLGDQQAFSISDADIDLLYNITSQNLTFNTSLVQTGVLNQGAGAAGRRSAIATLSAFPSIAFAQMNNGALLLPGATLTLYIVTNGAYTPLAQEQLVLYPYFQYFGSP